MMGEKPPAFPLDLVAVENSARDPHAGRLTPIMSTGQPPQDNPWAQQDPSRQPPPFDDAARRDPRAPFGPQPSSPSPPRFEPPGPRPRIWIMIVAVVAVVGIALFSLQFLVGVNPEHTTPSRPAVETLPSPTRTGNFKPFDGSVSGVFELTATRWSENGLEADYRIEVEGEADFSFFAYTNLTREAFVPEGDPSATASPGRPATGTLFFPGMPDVDATVVLATARGQTAIQALPVKAS